MLVFSEEFEGVVVILRTVTGLAAVFFLSLSLACASSPEDVEFAEMPSADELYADGMAELNDGTKIMSVVDTTDYQAAIDKFQDVIDNYPYSEVSTLAELRIADAFYDQQRYEEALSYYREFAELHPDNEKVPYTVYRTALSYVNQSETSNRDQTATREALGALDRVLTEYPTSPEAADAEMLWREMRTKLGDHVMGIADFYLDREEYQSAANRYRSVLNEFPGLGLDAEALYKLGVCYTHMSREDEAQKIFEVILENYEGSEIADAAQDLIPAAN
jgi:outer membrane protein assembly factor BamD